MQLSESLFPLSQPGCCSWRSCGREAQFRRKPNKIISNVNIVKRFSKAGGEFKGTRTFQQFLKRARRSHAIIFKKRWMSGLGSNQIVTSILRWAHNQIMRCKDMKSVLQNQRREVWTVTVEGNNALAGRGEVRKY